MTIELTDLKRYELEKENATNLILAANRKGVEITPADISKVLFLDEEGTDRLLSKLRTDEIIK